MRRHSLLLSLAVFLLGLNVPVVYADDVTLESRERTYLNQEQGLRYYERGDFEPAFEKLSFAAVRGLKKSQYMLAFMFLKGQYVDQSILLGMAWLGVSVESGDPEWIELYDNVYNKLSPAQQALVDAKVAQYIERYGIDAMNVTCARYPVTGSRRHEYRCIKKEGAFKLWPVERVPD